MKVLHPIHIIAPGPIAGAEKVVITGLKALQKYNCHPLCIIIQEHRAPQHALNFQKKLANISTILVKTTSSLDYKLIYQLRQIINTHSNSTVIHTHGFKALFYASFIHNSIALVHTHHGDTAHTFKVRAYEWLAYQLMKHVNHLIAVSQQMQYSLRQRMPHYVPIHLIPNMLPIKTLKTYTPYSQGRIRLIYVGRLSEEKGLHLFLPILKYFSSITLSIVGDGPQREELIHLAETLHITKQVDFLGYQNNISEHLVQHHALILPSLREGLPLTLIEAVCTGLPIFASNVGGIPELVNSGYNGVLFNEHSLQAMSKSLQQFCQQLSTLSTQANQQKKYFQDNYSSQQWATKTITLYQSLKH